MNHYAHALAALQAEPDHELKQIGDQWQTPKALAWGLFHQFAPTLGPVVLDMFADDCNALLPHYYDAEDNALTQELAADLRRLGGAAYANPPYSRPSSDGEGNPITGMEAILNYCREQRALGAKIMLLIKAATSETWWPEDADVIQFISGRIGFEVPSWYNPRDPKKDKPSSSGFASAVVIFDAGWQGERRPLARLRRDDLITTGTIILDMIHQQAVSLIAESGRVMATASQSSTSQAPVKQITPELHTQAPELDTQAGDRSTHTLPHWQQHPAVKAIIYQIDDADILTPARTAELAGWIIDHLNEPQLLEQATAKAAELLAQSIESISTEPDHHEQQLELLDGPEQAPDAHQQADEFSAKPLEDWAFDYQNDQLNLGGAAWHRFVTVLTVLYGERDAYTAREVAIAISLSDAQLRDQFTTMPSDERQRLERILNAMDTLEWNRSGAQRPLTDPLRQAAAAAIFASLKETADAPKLELLDRAIAAIASLKEEAA